LRPKLDAFAAARGEMPLQARRRVRSAAKWSHVQRKIKPELPPDLLGVYVFLPLEGVPQ
jgi:hypothetical protein